MMDADRRSFLRGALLTKQGREQTLRQRKPLGPLPPGMAGLLDQDSCRGCQQYCVSACRQDIVRIHPEEHRLAALPYLDFTQAGCTFCGDCTANCPIGAPTIRPAQRLGSARIAQEKCLAWNTIICTSCIGACQLHALVMDRLRRPGVDTDYCSGCGSCVARCPVQALEVKAEPTPRTFCA